MEEGEIRGLLAGLAHPLVGRAGWVVVDVLALLDAAPRDDLTAVAAWVERHNGELVHLPPIARKGLRPAQRAAAAGAPRVSRFVLPAAALEAP